jgi:hypothetical protein
VVKPGPSRVGQVNGEKLDDEEVVIRPACPAHKVVVFQLNIRICVVVVFDDVIGCSEAFWETHVTHVALECLGP